MYKATGLPEYLAKAEQFYLEFGLCYVPHGGITWDNKALGAQILLYEATGSAEYLSQINRNIDWYLNEATYTPLGLIWLNQWGSATPH